MTDLVTSRALRGLLARSAAALALGSAALQAQTAQPSAKPAPKSAATASAAWLTRPERTDYAETSRYDEVIAYMKQMAAVNPNIHLTTYGYTYEGRPLPLAVIGAPGASAEQVLATKKTRVYIQGNIHAGEVEGKEALLWLLRSIARGERNEWFKTTVLLINPIYNADGNERVSVTNRGSQAGPVGGMGTRENAQGLDLNRDGTKMETAEARSMASLLTRYQPEQRFQHDVRNVAQSEQLQSGNELAARRAAPRTHQDHQGQARLRLVVLRRRLGQRRRPCVALRRRTRQAALYVHVLRRAQHPRVAHRDVLVRVVQDAHRRDVLVP
jgi:hypothetical protein